MEQDFRRGHRSGIMPLLRRWLLCALVTLGGSSIASADDLADCNAATRPDVGIAACTRMIDAGLVQGHDLAVAYRNRGTAHFNKREDDEALADFARAVALDPKYASAYRGRGRVLGRKGQLDSAIADSTKRCGSIRTLPLSTTIAAWPGG
jgi:tetratricopeptide (TPR) repeat protein